METSVICRNIIQHLVGRERVFQSCVVHCGVSSSAQMPLLPLAKIYCLRAVVASSVALLALFFPLYMNCWFLYSWSHTYVAFWLSFALTIFILLHHLLMYVACVLFTFSTFTCCRSLNMEFFGGLPDVPLLLFEITGMPRHC